jgi:hypothetical protein
MIIAVLFWLLVIVTCAHAAAFGGKDGRRAAMLVIAASLLTLPATVLGRGWGRTELAILTVDLMLLAGLYALMLRSRRYWPIWMVGFHLVAVASHLGTMVVPDFTPAIYRALGSLWAIPMLLTMMIGIERDRKAQAAHDR